MLITLVFLVVAMKSRTFSSFPYSANEQVCRSWEGTEPGSQPKLARGNIPYHRHHAQFTNGGWPQGQEFFFLVSLSLNLLFHGSLKFYGSSVFFGCFVNFVKSVSLAFRNCC